MGPLTVMSRPTIETSTLGGTWIGRRPIRDIAGLPDVRQDFTTELGLVGLRAGHDALTGADDDEAETAEHPGDLGLARVHAQTGLADALEPGDDGALPSTYLSVTRSTWRAPSCSSRTLGDEALLQEDSGDLPLGPRGRDDDVARAAPATRCGCGSACPQSDRRRSFDSLPARLGDAGQLAEQRPLAEADAAQTEAPHETREDDRKRSSGGRPEPCAAAGRFALAIIDFLAMASPSPRLAGEGHAEEFEQTLRFLVGLRRRHDADLQPAETVHLVVVDLRERELLPKPQ